jgi:hypothetical protein
MSRTLRGDTLSSYNHRFPESPVQQLVSHHVTLYVTVQSGEVVVCIFSKRVSSSSTLRLIFIRLQKSKHGFLEKQTSLRRYKKLTFQTLDLQYSCLAKRRAKLDSNISDDQIITSRNSQLPVSRHTWVLETIQHQSCRNLEC